MRINEDRYGGYDKEKSKRDVKRFCKNYIESWREKNIKGELKLLSKY